MTINVKALYKYNMNKAKVYNFTTAQKRFLSISVILIIYLTLYILALIPLVILPWILGIVVSPIIAHIATISFIAYDLHKHK